VEESRQRAQDVRRPVPSQIAAALRDEVALRKSTYQSLQEFKTWTLPLLQRLDSESKQTNTLAQQGEEAAGQAHLEAQEEAWSG